jgi:hypothetical protein
MTWLLSADPGKNTGIALGYYDATTPYQLHQRWQVHRGLDGFIHWWRNDLPDEVDEIVVEKFVSKRGEMAPDLSGVPIEGVIALGAYDLGIPVIWQTAAQKGSLVGYPESARTKAQRQRVRFNFLDRHGLFKAGTENDDSNDAITHALISLKVRRHAPTLRRFFPPREGAV